jgi:hypothetical protein
MIWSMKKSGSRVSFDVTCTHTDIVVSMLSVFGSSRSIDSNSDLGILSPELT